MFPILFTTDRTTTGDGGADSLQQHLHSLQQVSQPDAAFSLFLVDRWQHVREDALAGWQQARTDGDSFVAAFEQQQALTDVMGANTIMNDSIHCRDIGIALLNRSDMTFSTTAHFGDCRNDRQSVLFDQEIFIPSHGNRSSAADNNFPFCLTSGMSLLSFVEFSAVMVLNTGGIDGIDRQNVSLVNSRGSAECRQPGIADRKTAGNNDAARGVVPFRVHSA